MKLRTFPLIAAAVALAACAGNGASQGPAAFPASGPGFQAWTAEAPDYTLYPGDQLDVKVPSAPELNQSVTVAPDGNVSFPLIGQVEAANRTVPEFEAALTEALSTQLLRPQAFVTPTAFESQRILVLGEVGQPGLYDLPGPIGALEAVAIAGGFANTAERGEVGIIRRAPDGGPMLRVVDLEAALNGAATYDVTPLRRFDVIYVPRSDIAEANLFVQQYIRDLLPFNIGFSYASGNGYLSN